MPKIQWTYPFRCTNCNIRISQSTMDNKCLKCGNDIYESATCSNGMVSVMWGLLVIVLGIMLILKVIL